LNEDNQDRLVDFVLDGNPREPDLPKKGDWYFALSNVSHYIGLWLILGIFALILLISFAGGEFHPVGAGLAVSALILLLVFANSA